MPQEVIREYFPNHNYEDKVEKFFSMRDKDLQDFLEMTYPFYGRQMLDPQFFKILVSEMPEFLASVIDEGYGTLITASTMAGSVPLGHTILSRETFLQCMKTILQYWILWGSLGQKSENEVTVTDEERDWVIGLIKSLGQPITITEEYYDLRGCLQHHYNKFWMSHRVFSILEPQEISRLTFQHNFRKKTIMNILCKRGADPQYLHADFREDNWHDSNLTYPEDYVNFDQSRGALKRILDNAAFIGPDHEAIIRLRISELKEEAEIVDLYEKAEPKATPEYLMMNASSQTSVSDFGVNLCTPDDQSSDLSPVYLEMLQSEKMIGRTKLSHMEAAFVYYLGLERSANESLWLSYPEKHKEELSKIWASFSLPEYFEEEISLSPPIKGLTHTWIWDFNNTNRKSLSNRINNKVKAISPQNIDFRIVESYKSSKSPYGGNYKLNSHIKSFEIIPPSK
ncbi:MAG: hypothetical protein HOG80_13765 [Candidatus Marinimicrobia bacterium]|jgi:hypothetical protein|nr:hypothetical protein [Candidatus Neomarinimicrobiota bacterium]MBT5314404.1 hypothetical protein [Candidatus Neomarinimicrobiota bacterium]MBT5465410.1 hypothetical protein [Candidatus Neomarinimicrobiota bacterium]MBT6012435.1 hypothetical protein [Candidatus Neomarinimicrobiota bacterium]MBT7201756.1 hypothetical protein [Candidatus Neomarinimicrobiota bacterium]